MPVAGPSTADRSVADRSADGDGLASSRADDSPAPDERATVPVARPIASLSFPREARLLDKRAYDAVFGDNRRLADRYWTVLVHTPGEASGTAARARARLGLAIAKKRARRAVDRNRIKRVARESFRHVRDSLGDRQVVIMNRDAARDATAAELRRALDVLWSRLLRQSAPARARSGEERVP